MKRLALVALVLLLVSLAMPAGAQQGQGNGSNGRNCGRGPSEPGAGPPGNPSAPGRGPSLYPAARGPNADGCRAQIETENGGRIALIPVSGMSNQNGTIIVAEGDDSGQSTAFSGAGKPSGNAGADTGMNGGAGGSAAAGAQAADSSGAQLGSATTDEFGNAALKVRIPDGATGSFPIVVRGTDVAGNAVMLRTAVLLDDTVGAAGGISSPVTAGDEYGGTDDTILSTPASAASAAPVVWQGLLLLAVLLAVGFSALGLARRTRRAGSSR